MRAAPDPAGARRLRQPAPRRGETLLGRLKEDILSLAIGAGERLYENAIAARYQASRTPAREALMRLLEEGLVVREGRAYVIRLLTLPEIEQLYDVREILECRSVVLATQHATPDDVAALTQHVAAMVPHVDSEDYDTFNRADSAFHLMLAQLSGNSFLESQLRMIHERVRMIRGSHFARQERLIGAQDEHVRITMAIARRDVAVAQAEMRSHIRGSIWLLNGNALPFPDFSEVAVVTERMKHGA